MRRLRPWLAAAAAMAVAIGDPAFAADGSPVGVWRTFSDKDGLESGRVEIAEHDGVLSGRVVGVVDPAKRDKNCIKCTDDRRDQKVMGLEILRGMRPDGARWDGGQILDPEEGKTYRCLMRLEDGGRTLVVRGFIGLAMFGRSQRWLRAE